MVVGWSLGHACPLLKASLAPSVSVVGLGAPSPARPLAFGPECSAPPSAASVHMGPTQSRGPRSGSCQKMTWWGGRQRGC